MARPRKIGLDYFPVDVHFDEQFESLIELHGNDALAWMIRFWQKAYRSEFGIVDLSDIRGVIGAKTTLITTDKQSEIIKDCIKLGLLYETSPQNYTSNGIQKRIKKIIGEREYDRNYAKNELSERKQPDNQPITGEIEIKVNKIKDIVKYLNLKCKTSFRETSANTKKHISARLSEKYTVEDFKKVIDFKVKEWLVDEKMKQYLRPDTLFGTKFESYLNAAKSIAEKPVWKPQ